MSLRDLKEKLLEIQGELLKEAKTITGSSLKTFLDEIMELMYIEPGQFILEFLQNTEDALMEAGKKGYFKLELYKDKVVIRNDGKPIDEADLESLCAIKSRKKPSLGYKGFIGIGWKSVYKVSDHVEVHSAGTCFEFNKEFWRRPEAEELLKKYNRKPEDVLWQITPIPIKPIEVLPEETKFVVYLRDGSKYEEIAKTLDELVPSMFLFLEHVNEVEISDEVKGRRRRVRWFTTSEEMLGDVKVSRSIVVEDGLSREFLVFKREFEVPEDVRADPLTEKAKRRDVVKREVAIAFGIDGATGELKPLDGTRLWAMHSFLPLHEVRTGLKFAIQADFIVHPGRRYINVEAKWNHWLMKCVTELLRSVISYLMKRFTTSYLRVLDYSYVGDEVWEKLIRPYVLSLMDEVLRDPIVICYKGHEAKLSQVVKASEEVFELIKHGLFDEEDLKQVYKTDKHILDPRAKLRERDFVPLLSLSDLLNEELIKTKVKTDFEKAVQLLGNIYEIAYKKNLWIPLEKRFVITSSGAVKLAQDVYSPELPDWFEELRGKFPEVEDYVKTLDFIHESLRDFMTKTMGIGGLKWLGVKEVTLRQIVAEEIIKHITAKGSPLERDKLAIATTIVKKAELKPTEPIWVLTKDGGVESSERVWYPELFDGIEEVARLLDLKLLDLEEYLKYDEDKKGWRRFFEKVVRGLDLYEVKGYYSRYYYYLHDYVVKIIEKVVEVLERTTAEENVKFIRFLKRLYDKVPSERLMSIKVKLVADDGSLVPSNEALLHEAYGAEEKWSKWRSEGFAIGPFVSPMYIDGPEHSWKAFLTKVLEVKEVVSSEVVERFAEWFAEKKLAEKGYKVVGRGEECDLMLKVGEDIVCVEVKGRRKRIEELEVELTERETKRALDRREKCWLVIVEGIPNDPKAWLVRDPARFIGKINITGRRVKEEGELL